jgi:hypothetical protein
MTTPREIPGYLWDAEKQRYFKVVRSADTVKGAPAAEVHSKRRRSELSEDVKECTASLVKGTDLAQLLRSREIGLLHYAAALPDAWESQRARHLRLRAFSAERQVASGSCDAALLPSLTSGNLLLAGGTGTGALQLLHVCNAEDRMQVDVLDTVGRRSQVQAACRVDGNFGPDAAVVACAWLGSGESAGVVGISKIRLRSGAASLKEIANFVFKGSVWSLSAASSADSLIAGVNTSVMHIDLRAMRQRILLAQTRSDVLTVAPNSALTAICGLRNGAVVCIDSRQAADSKPVQRCRLPAAVTSVSLHPQDERYIVACGVDGTLGLYDGRRWSQAPCLPFSGHRNTAALMHRHTVHGNLVAAPGTDGLVRLWSLNSGGRPLSESCEVTGHVHQSLAFQDDGCSLWLGSWNGLGNAILGRNHTPEM